MTESLDLAFDAPTRRLDLEGLSIEVLQDKNDVDWYQQRAVFEEKASPLYRLIAKEGYSTFVDVGANVGLISILASRACPGIDVVAIEPDPRLVRLMRRNFRSHGMDAEIVNAVAGEEMRSSVTFGLNPTSTLDNRVVQEDWTRIEVPMVRVGEILDRAGKVGKTFIKIDTQGYEYHVLRGMESWLAGRRDWTIKLEFAPDWLRSQGTDPIAFLDYLSQRFQVAEHVSRVAFATRGIDALFENPVPLDQHTEFVAHVASLNRGGLGWVDLMLRPLDKAMGARAPAFEETLEHLRK